jgi:hypothetical protein
MRGFAISFLTLTRVARSDFVMPFFCGMSYRGIDVEAAQSDFAQMLKYFRFQSVGNLFGFSVRRKFAFDAFVGSKLHVAMGFVQLLHLIK